MRFWKEIHEVVDAHHEAPIIHSKKRHLGIILTMAGYIFYAMYTVFFQVEAFRSHAVNSPYALFFELTVLHFIMFLTFLAFCLAQGKQYFRCNKPWYVLLRSAMAIGILVLYSLARVWTSNVDNSMLYSTDAFWLVLFLYMLKIQTPKGVWVGVVIGTLGILFIWSLDFSSVHDIVGGLFGTLSGVLLAITIFLTRYMVRRDPPLRIGFYNSLFGLIFFGIGTIILGSSKGWEFPEVSAIPIMAVSGFIWALALFFFLEAFYFTETHIIGAIALFFPIFTETFNWAINGESLRWPTLTGSLITGAGGLVVIIASYLSDKKNSHKSKKFKQFEFPETIESDEPD
ncbi:hypothetical protein COB11_04335 [Candidatus Aerophobetes bacterium]|uniref:EamA domain-containing protein n=1 Tax=Aerophobetes bacterium TaxID=2030807 RepID=A0A2A4YHP8_UNCAE|nr:MAG: hypothetical protein COB11_04335 [Candidatus Aerophobetes bacterium]